MRNTEHRTSNVQHRSAGLFQVSILDVGRWALGVRSWAFFFLAVFAGFVMPCCAAALPDPEADFAVAYTLELSGADLPAALAAYRALVERAGTNTALAARAGWRIGVCERLQEHWAASRDAWHSLITNSPGPSALVEQARVELRELDRVTERVVLSGQVLDSAGQPVPQAFLMIGDWATDASALADDVGRFSVQRRTASSRDPTRRFVFVYAEHPSREEALLEALPVSAAGTSGLVVRLRLTVAVEGRVTDPAGRPLASVRIETEAVDPASGLSLPYQAVLPPVTSDSNGTFLVRNLIEGLPVRFQADLEGYQRAEADFTASRARFRSAGIVLFPAGRVGIEGVVTDERGQPLDAAVSALSFTPDETQVASARTDLNGRYRLVELPDRPLSVVAEAAGFCERRVSGVRPGPRRIDLVLGRPGPAPERRGRVGDTAPVLDAVALNAASLTAGSLKHHVALIYFWSRPRPLNPPALIEEVQRRYAAAGLRVVCLHDASALPEDLAVTALRQGVSYVVAIDRYAPVAGTGALHSATFDAFGARAGDAALIDGQGLVAWRGRLHDPAAQAELDTMLAALVAEAEPAGQGAVGRALLRGAAVPPLRVRWLRGLAVSGAAPREEDLRGKIVVYHFGSVFAESSRREESSESVALPLWPRGSGRESVVCVWILPSGESSEEAAQAALGLAPEALIAVDRAGETYRAFDAREAAENTIADGEGCVWAAGRRNEQVFRAVKELLASRGRIQD